MLSLAFDESTKDSLRLLQSLGLVFKTSCTYAFDQHVLTSIDDHWSPWRLLTSTYILITSLFPQRTKHVYEALSQPMSDQSLRYVVRTLTKPVSINTLNCVECPVFQQIWTTRDCNNNLKNCIKTKSSYMIYHWLIFTILTFYFILFYAGFKPITDYGETHSG